MKAAGIDPPFAPFRQKMATEGSQQIYQQRSQVAQFPFANMKDKYGLRKFRVIFSHARRERLGRSP